MVKKVLYQKDYYGVYFCSVLAIFPQINDYINTLPCESIQSSFSQ